MSDLPRRNPDAPGANANERRFRVLIESHLDDSLTDTTRAELEQLLATDARMRRVFVEVCLHDQITHRLLAPNGADLSLPALVDADEADEAGVDASDHNSVMATLVEDALRARRLEEVKERAANALYASRSKERQLADRRAQALQAKGSMKNSGAPHWVGWGLIAAALILAVWVGMALDNSPKPSPQLVERGETSPVTRKGSVAHVRDSIDARWSTTTRNARYLHTGEAISLEAGLAEVVFEDGATVILQGPVTFEPTGPDGLRLVSGRMSASVPQGSGGFRVDTADMVVTNEHAEFGVYTDPQSGSQATAFAGVLTIDTREVAGTHVGSISQVYAGSTAFNSQAGLAVVRADTHAFVLQEEYEVRADAADGDAYSRWLAYSYELRRDPGVVAYFTFDHRDDSPDTLINRAARNAGRLNGTLGHAGDPMTIPRWVEGRFPEKQALRFGVVGPDRAKAVIVEGLGGLDLGDALTLAVWVRTPSSQTSAGGGTLLSLRDTPVRHLGFQFSLFMKGDPYPESLQFGTGNELVVDHPNDNFVYSDARSISASDWHLAVVVYNRGEASFFIDGQQVSQSRLPREVLAVTRPGASLLIGTDPYMPNFNNTSRVEAFTGDIDEVVILDRTMTRDEINEMYQVGRPDPQ